ncbi:endonuclease/exonuclease/phosphatase family protein [Albidovulum inexpectatum]|uniref:Endonuclease/exonuclease/phosphatase family protein n=1 Tax=Albidovulum inexpectatum TaxID=196587 RepID=A0A2S5JLN3_9RHOB|nr:endonuclease/exonuclease/phosphatase family protein [Albidovulum inexpectatum]PPB82416.1 endonuclease/exonuclease/phosphatase family protein [Albidovulum inexpectatum]
MARLPGLAASLFLLFLTPAVAETLRLATFEVEMTRRGPGLLLRDISSGKDSQTEAVAEVIATVRPDVLLLTGFDYDLDLVALRSLRDRIAARGVDYPHLFALRPNSGWQTGLDLDGDGRIGGPGDARGWGRFAGAGGMAILSRHPIDHESVLDLSSLRWADLPGALIDEADLPREALGVLPVSSTGHWVVPVVLPSGTRLSLLAFRATPPVFDGPEDRNARRNRDEIALWRHLLEGRLSHRAPKPPLVILGNFNLDPVDGEGRRDALNALLSNPTLVDPAPVSTGAARAARMQGGANDLHHGNPALDTVDWPDDTGPGNLRVDYVLPSSDLTIRDAGVFWPDPEQPGHRAAQDASRHRLVWVDVDMP